MDIKNKGYSMILSLKQDRDYTVVETSSDNWFKVLYKESMVAIVMSLETARQVIYREINAGGGTCEYLHEKDFVKKFTKNDK